MMPTFAAAVSTTNTTYAEPNYGTFDPDPVRGRTQHRTSRSSSAESRDTFGAARKRKRSASMDVLTSPLPTPLSEHPPTKVQAVRYVRSVPGIESPLQSRWSSATEVAQPSLGEADDTGCLSSCRALLRSFWRGLCSFGA